MNWRFVLAFLTIVNCLAAQNLVPNPSFEKSSDCASNYTKRFWQWHVTNWVKPTQGTPDHFSTCTQATVGVPQNFMGNCFPKSGNAYAGVILLEDPPLDTIKRKRYFDYREYLQVRLTEPLIARELYTVGFHYALATYSTFALNRLGIYISHRAIRNWWRSNVLPAKPQICMDTTTINIDRETWIMVSDTFRAKGGEKFITLGNFYNDRETAFTKLDAKAFGKYMENRIDHSRIAYYYIDDVFVIPSTKEHKTIKK